MVKRAVNMPENEPEESKFEIPSETEHLFQVVDVYDSTSDIGIKLKLDENTVSAKCEVTGSDEEGRTLLIRISLDESWKGFFFTRLFLKAIGEPHKGSVEIDTDRFIGRQFYATVKHKDGFANIFEYNFDKKIEQVYQAPVKTSDAVKAEEIAW
jgi:hypothetical protein